jgi:DUF1707 SHOCT-like domain
MNERHDIEQAVRASDTERERIAKMISEAAGEGRLSIAEADERLERVYTTKFRHELAEFVADLPAETRQSQPARLERFPIRLRAHAAVAVVVSVLLILRWAAMDVPFFWPAGPMIVLWGTFLLHARFVRSGRVPPWARQRSGPPWWVERQRVGG